MSVRASTINVMEARIDSGGSVAGIAGLLCRQKVKLKGACVGECGSTCEAYTIQDDGFGGPRADIANDSAHRSD